MAKKKVTLWIEPEYAEKLEALARLEGLAVSQYGGALLERGIRQANDSVGLDLIETRLKLVMKKEFKEMTKAMEKLLVYTAVEAGTSTILLRSHNIGQLGAEEESKLIDKVHTSIRKTVYNSPLTLANLLPEE